MRKSRRKPVCLGGQIHLRIQDKDSYSGLKGRYSLSELAERFDLHLNQISQWKQEFLANSSDVFDKKIT